MDLATIVGLVMIVVFVITISKRWLSPFVALIVCPLVAAVVFCLISGTDVMEVFDWIYDGVFFHKAMDGDTITKVTAGTTRSALMILFACTYFTLMMQVGLFDPLIIAIIKLVKGDPLKVLVAATCVAAGVSLDGDGASTVLITTGAFMPLFKQFGLKGSYLAVLICLPTAVFNMSPWGGPLARVLSALDLDVTEVFPKLLPGMAVVLVYSIGVAYYLGLKERKRLGFDPKDTEAVSDESINNMIALVKDQDAELKRPKLIWFNLIVTLIIMVVLIMGLVNSALLFMIGIALCLVVNYGFDFNFQKQRLAEILEEGMPACAMIVASGFLMGVLNYSGIGDALANFLASLVPAGMENLLPLFTAILGIPGLIFLSSDGYYFGILPVLAGLASNYGIAASTMGVAAMIPLATYYATPLIAWIFILVDRCEVPFPEHQKNILKWGIPAFAIYCIVFVITGAMPLF